jgi:type 1 fimbria pilin
VQSGSAVVGVTVGGVASNTMTETFQPVAQVTGGFAQSSVRVLQVAANATPGKATIVVTSGSASAQATFTVAAPLGCPAS